MDLSYMTAMSGTAAYPMQYAFVHAGGTPIRYSAHQATWISLMSFDLQCVCYMLLRLLL